MKRRICGLFAALTLLVTAVPAPVLGQVFPRRFNAPTAYRPYGQARWQASGLGLLYGGFTGFVVGSHIDRRVGSSSPDEVAVTLMLAGSLSGAIGGYVWGSAADVEPGRLGLTGSAVLWGSVLTLGIRGAVGRTEDGRASLLMGTTLGLVAWNLWDDVELSRGMSWFIDAGAALGALLAVVIADSSTGSSFTGLETDEDFEQQAKDEMFVFTVVFAGALAATTALAVYINEPAYRRVPVSGFDMQILPTFSASSDRPGLALVGRF